MPVHLFRSFHKSFSSSKPIEPSSSSLLLRDIAGSQISLLCQFNLPFHFLSIPTCSCRATAKPSILQSVPCTSQRGCCKPNEEEEWCSEAVQQVVLSSKQFSTRMIYLAKWKRFDLVHGSRDPTKRGFHPGHLGVTCNIFRNQTLCCAQFTESAFGSDTRVPFPDSREVNFSHCHGDEISEGASPLTFSCLRIGSLVGPKLGSDSSDGPAV